MIRIGRSVPPDPIPLVISTDASLSNSSIPVVPSADDTRRESNDMVAPPQNLHHLTSRPV
eukprot:scaffold1353_cov161-Amphora_coffeaeformis.AAC.29